MRIGILLCGHAPDEYIEQRGDIDALFRDLLGERGFEFQTWPVVDMDFPDSPKDADAWLVTGSKHGVYEDLPFIAPLEDFIRDIRHAERPLVGICFGHQIIAQAFGGHVEKFDGGWQRGLQSYALGDGDLSLYAWHQDQVITAPSGARTLASNPGCTHAILSYGPNCLTIQGHPEFERDFIETLIEHRAGSATPEELAAVAAKLDHPPDRARAATLIANTLRHGSSA